MTKKGQICSLNCKREFTIYWLIIYIFETLQKENTVKYREGYDPSNNTHCVGSQYFLLGKFFLMVQFGEYPHLNKHAWLKQMNGVGCIILQRADLHINTDYTSSVV
jgi:hypothetical protein